MGFDWTRRLLGVLKVNYNKNGGNTAKKPRCRKGDRAMLQ